MVDITSVRGISSAIVSNVGFVGMRSRPANDNTAIATAHQMRGIKDTSLQIVKHLISIDASLKAQVQANMFAYNQSIKQQREDLVEQYRGFGNEEAGPVVDAVPAIQETTSSIGMAATALAAGAAALSYSAYVLYEKFQESVTKAMGAVGAIASVAGAQQANEPEREPSAVAPITPAPKPQTPPKRTNTSPAPPLYSDREQPTPQAATVGSSVVPNPPRVPQQPQQPVSPTPPTTPSPNAPSQVGAAPEATRLQAPALSGSNGRLSTSQLSRVTGGGLLQPAAAAAYEKMVAAAKADGIVWSITDSYRTYDEQVRTAREKGLYSEGGLAATPGKSNHGWGTALDLGGGANKNGTAQNEWLRNNAHIFGFKTIPREPWHWEYKGPGVTKDQNSGPGIVSAIGTAITETYESLKQSFSELGENVRNAAKLMPSMEKGATTIGVEQNIARIRKDAEERERDILASAKRVAVVRKISGGAPSGAVIPPPPSVRGKSVTVVGDYFERFLGVSLQPNQIGLG